MEAWMVSFPLPIFCTSSSLTQLPLHSLELEAWGWMRGIWKLQSLLELSSLSTISPMTDVPILAHGEVLWVTRRALPWLVHLQVPDTGDALNHHSCAASSSACDFQCSMVLSLSLWVLLHLSRWASCSGSLLQDPYLVLRMWTLLSHGWWDANSTVVLFTRSALEIKTSCLNVFQVGAYVT